ncbi:DUF6705 family protein [Lacinutrix undariae]
MKKYILILIALFGFTAFGQTIKPIETEWLVDYSEKNDTYFKDVNNVLDKFVGTWRYEDLTTNTVFEVTFTKLLHQESRKNGFKDVLSAQFKLTVNGVEQYNTYTTPCANCFIAGGFNSFLESSDALGNLVTSEVSPNMYIGAMVEPTFEDDVSASDLKLRYMPSLLGDSPTLLWVNRVSKVSLYSTGERINNYATPLEMVLTKVED